jgi:hypothetical protein
MIEAEQLLTEIDGVYIHEVAGQPTAVVFGRIHEQRSQAGTLALRIDREQPEIGPIAAGLDVDAANEHSFAFSRLRHRYDPRR